MKEVYGYIRVSTAKQGEKGVSLIEQKDAITRYAQLNNLHIISWFEERETAAKRGRTEFTKMMALLKSGVASGVIIHKIDRSARNLRDWADLVDLSDQGVEIRFVNECIDMGARGGRLSADIQAVVATDYIRNLREESLKGLRGRLKQGLFPWRAPVGYLDMGGGKVKEIDPAKAPIVRDLFEQYATGEHSLKSLLKYAHDQGLTNTNGRQLSQNGIATILHNPFYFGVIFVRSMNETFVGNHAPIISKERFDVVQNILQGKTIQGNGKHEHIFRRLFSCVKCSRSLIGEKQKGHVYYRCHNCPGTSLREEAIEDVIAEVLEPFELCEHEIKEVEYAQKELLETNRNNLDIEKKALTIDLNAFDARLSKLTDAYLDETIDKDLYLKKKAELIYKVQSIKTKLLAVSQGISTNQQMMNRNLELYKTAYLSYFEGKPVHKRQLLRELTSNRSVCLKNVVIELHSPFKELCEAKKFSYCPQCRVRSRTLTGKYSQRESFREFLKQWINSFSDKVPEVLTSTTQ